MEVITNSKEIVEVEKEIVDKIVGVLLPYNLSMWAVEKILQDSIRCIKKQQPLDESVSKLTDEILLYN